MPNNTVKPIMVTCNYGSNEDEQVFSLSTLEHEWEGSENDNSADKAENFSNLLAEFFSVCKRLRLEVKRHKKTKKEMNGHVALAAIDSTMCDEVDAALGDYRRPDESLAEAVKRLREENTNRGWNIENSRSF